MKSLRLLLILILVGCGVAFTHSERVYAAPLLTLDPLTITVSRDQPTTISLVVDTTPHTTLTSAVTLRYQPDDVMITGVSNGDIFPSLTSANDTDTGTLELTAYTTDKAGIVGRTGTLATLTLVGLKDSGTTTLTIVCSGSGHDTNILTTKGVNVYTCGAAEAATIQMTAIESPILTGAKTPLPTQPTEKTRQNDASRTEKVAFIVLLAVGIGIVLVILRVLKQPEEPNPPPSIPPVQ